MIIPEEKWRSIKGFLFDVDGVLSPDVTPLDDSGDPVRTANIKDGYAIRQALAKGFIIGIITGGIQNRVKLRYQRLGVTLFYDDCREKTSAYQNFLFQTKLLPQEILYMGDDIPDLPVMRKVGLASCPADAVQEVKEVSEHISDKRGGYGCVREVIEKVLRQQNKWSTPDLSANQSI